MYRIALIFAAVLSLLAVACGSGNERALRRDVVSPPIGSPQPTSTPEKLTGIPSGSLLFRAAEGYSDDLYLIDPDGSNLTQLTDSTENDSPGAFSPDGSLIAYNAFLREDRADGVYVMSPDGSNPRLVAGGDWDWFTSWSSKGRILFGSGGIGPSDYWTVNADGSNPVRILEKSDYGAADWSPDGESLIVSKCATSTTAGVIACDLSIIDEQGTEVRKLLENDPRKPGLPKWSPDGSHILFATRTPEQATDALIVMDTEGTNERNLYELPVNSSWYTARWSPDGSQIALSIGDRIVILSLADSSSRTLALGRSIEYLDWSPDGAKIAYVSEQDGSRLYVVDISGGEPVAITDPALNSQVSWSPDGKQILFASNRNRQAGVYWASPHDSERHRLDELSTEWRSPATPSPDVVGGCRKGSVGNSCLSPDGKSEAAVYPNTKVITIRDVVSGATRSIGIEGTDPWPASLVWSPDGGRLALYAGRDQKRGLYIVDVATEEASLIVADATAIGSPTIAWSPDGSYVYYLKGMICGEGCAPGFLYRIHLDGSGEERVIDMRIDSIYGFVP